MGGEKNNYGKRSQSQEDYFDDGGNKRRDSGGEREPHASKLEDTIYRFLCAGKEVGSIIGRGGEIVKQLRADTHAKIIISDNFPDCEDRVVTIFSTSEETNFFADSGDFICPAQDALLRVHEKLVREAPDEANDDGAPQVTVRILVPSDQVGCIIGKGGQVIQSIRHETGAQIRILKDALIPPCAMANDELLQITGEARVVKKALFQLSSRLRDNPSSRSRHLLTSQSDAQSGGSNVRASGMGAASLMGPYGEHEGDAARDRYHSRGENSPKEFGLLMLCLTSNIGGVIGKGGVTIKQIRHESGAYIKVDSSSAEDDCLISISANELFEDPRSPTIDAALLLQPRCSEKTERESGEPLYTTRLLVNTSKIGCLIGKGGSVISEMRRATRANIRILSKGQLPTIASEDEELVQISGDLDIARDALIQVAKQLKANLFGRENVPSALPPKPYHSRSSDMSGRRDSRHDRGYSYSGRHGALDANATYDGSQGSGDRYETHGGYSGRRLSDSNTTRRRRHGY